MNKQQRNEKELTDICSKVRIVKLFEEQRITHFKVRHVQTSQ